MSIRGIDKGGFNPEPQGSQQQHTVQQGETLQSIADQHGVLPEVIRQANPQIGDGSNLQAGMVLEFPNLDASPETIKGPAGDSIEQGAAANPFEANAVTSGPQGFTTFQSLLTAQLSPKQIEFKGEDVVIKNDSLNNFFKTFLNQPDTRAGEMQARSGGKTPEQRAFIWFSQGDAQGEKPLAGEAGAKYEHSSGGSGEAYPKTTAGEAAGKVMAPGEAIGKYASVQDQFLEEAKTPPGDAFQYQQGRPSAGEGMIWLKAAPAEAKGSPTELPGDAFQYKQELLSPGETASRFKSVAADAFGNAQANQSLAGAGTPLQPEQFEFNSEGNLIIHSNELGSALQEQIQQNPSDQASFNFNVGRKIE